eukprot:363864-Chlamydomonas_euryale.AAC.9
MGCTIIWRVQGLSQASGYGLGLRLLHDSVTNPRLVIAARRAPKSAPSCLARALLASSFCRLLLAGLWLVCAALRHMRSHMKPRLYLPERPVRFLVKKLVHPRRADRDGTSMGCQHARCMPLHGSSDQSTN